MRGIIVVAEHKGEIIKQYIVKLGSAHCDPSDKFYTEVIVTSDSSASIESCASI